MAANRGWEPDWAIPPGETLAEALQERGMTQVELARRLDRPLKTVNEIVKGKAAITAETAIQLERALGINAKFWIGLESLYRERLARLEAREQLSSQVSWARRFPLAAMARYGLISKSARGTGAVADLLDYFKVSSSSAWEREWLRHSAAFRRPAKWMSTVEAISAWLRWGQLQAAAQPSGEYDAARFRTMLPTLRSLTREDLMTALPALREACRSCGVIVMLIPEFPGAPVSGATQWLPGNRVLIQLSLRHKTDDQFWFTFFHEAGHVCLHSKDRSTILDWPEEAPDPAKLTVTHDATGRTDADEVREEQANDFARASLFAEPIEGLLPGVISAESIRELAHRLGIAPGLVVGQLQRSRMVDYSQWNFLKQRVRWLNGPA